MLFRSHIEAGRLQPVFDPDWAIPVQAHFLVYPERHGYRPEVAQFLEWLGTQVGQVPGPAVPKQAGSP